MTTTKFEPVKRPEEVVVTPTLDEELNSKEEAASTTIYFISVTVKSANDLPNKDLGFDVSDPYCIVTVGDLSDQTATVGNCLNPEWNEKMAFFLSKKPESIYFKIADENLLSNDDFIAKAELAFKSFSFDGQVPLKNKHNEEIADCSIEISMTCNMVQPVKTKIQMDFLSKSLSLEKEYSAALLASLDESENLRQQTIDTAVLHESEIATLKHEIFAKESKYQTELKVKDETISKQGQQINENTTQLESTSSELKESQQTNDETKAKLAEAEKQLAATKIQLDTTSKDLADKEQEIKNLLSELSDAKNAKPVWFCW